jgi:transposase
MAHRQPERRQGLLFPPSLEAYIEPDDPVRAYDAFVEALDFEALQVEGDPHQPGCPAYDPKTMLKILVYGYSYGIRSSRKIERALHHNVSFIWLAGGLKPAFKTISRFRRDNRTALKKVLKHCARLCLALDVVAGNTLFVDGSKVRANASLGQHTTSEGGQKQRERIDRRIDEILDECGHLDAQEAEQDSLIHLKEELAQHQSRKAKIEAAMAVLQAEALEKVNVTDPSCAIMRSRQGTHAAYNAQIVVDDQHGLILQTDVVNENTDRKQFADQVTAAEETLGEKAQTAAADSGYYSGKELEKMVATAEQVLVPVRGQVHRHGRHAFAKRRFTYRVDEDVYVCPAGQRLTYRRTNEERHYREYQLDGRTCCACRHYRQCTRGRNGRKVVRYFNEDLRDRLRREFEQPAAKAIYARRKQKVELPFGHIKRNLGAGNFLLRGLSGVRAEMSLLSCCFNMARLIGLLGVRGLITRLAAL